MLRVLLVAVHADTRAVCSRLLEHHGFDVVVPPDTAHALTELRQRDYDLVLSDGDLAHDQIRDLVRLAGPAAVGLLGGPARSSDQVAGEGVAFCLPRPVRTPHLLTKISTTLNISPVTDAQRVTLDRYFGFIERADWAGLATTCAVDVLYHLPVDDPQFGRTIGGRSAFCEFAAQTFGTFQEPRFEIQSVRALPRGASVRYTGSWLAPDGSRPSMPGAVLFVFDHDQIREIGVRLDVAALHLAA